MVAAPLPETPRVTQLQPGDPAPDFMAPATVNERFHFNTVGGYRVALVFLGHHGSDGARALRIAAWNALAPLRAGGLQLFLVALGPDAPMDHLRDGVTVPVTTFRDIDGALHRRYGMWTAGTDDQPARPLRGAVVIDQSLRIVGLVRSDAPERVTGEIAALVARIPARPPAREVMQHAPVLIVPDVFPRETCQALIAYYDRQGGGESGFMREIDGRTVGIMDSRFKRRKDCLIEDEGLRRTVRETINRRLCPAIYRAFNFNATRLERYLVACYDGETGGFFRAHRDNTTKGTAHRRFAVTVNLNAEDYDGGNLRFPEFSDDVYRAPTGGAVVFGCSLLHEALPVTRGRRYALLPFLFDEAAEALRTANLGFLDSDRVINLDQQATSSSAA